MLFYPNKMKRRHTTAELQLANACHPSMDGSTRRAILWQVAVDNHDHRWMRRLKSRGSVPTGMAMVMLDDYEGGPKQNHVVYFMTITGIILLLWMLYKTKTK